MRRTWYALPVVAMMGAWLAWGMTRPPVPVQLAELKRGPFEQTVDADGKTRVRERYLVSAPLAGRIGRVALKAGDVVEAGQVVATLTPAAPALIDARARQQLTEQVGATEARHAQALADQAQAEAVVRKREADAARVRQLAQAGFLSSAQLEQAGLELQVAGKAADAARQAVHVAEHEQATARAALRQSVRNPAGEAWPVRAPVAGMILKVWQESEASIAQGTPLLEIGNPAELEIVADVLSSDAVQIAPGNPVWIERWGGPQALRAQVRRVEPSAVTKVSVLGVEEQRVNVLIDLKSPSHQASPLPLRDGFRVEARIVVYQAGQALLLPLGALFRQGDGWAVFAVDGGRAHVRTVEIGRRSQRDAVVVGGLKEGSLVVLYPPDTLSDGMRVKAGAR